MKINFNKGSVMKSLILVVAMFLASCGQMSNCKSGEEKNNIGECKSELADNKSSVRSISGSLSGAFDVIVDGNSYSDIEAYYSSEIEALPARIEALGYKDYSVKLDAKIGFKDLTNNMMVFISPVSNRDGYATKGYVGSDDKFNFVLPAFAPDASYRVKAVKRIALILTSETEVKKFCFNFKTVEVKADLVDGKSSPVVLNQFESELTQYDCAQAESKEGITPPKAK